MKALLRLCAVVHIITRYRLDLLLPQPRRLWPIALLAWFTPSSWRITHRLSRGQRLIAALIALGPIYIKFGQVLSTRRDLLPPDIADALIQLQDQVPPFPDSTARALLTAAYQQPLDEIFLEIADTPLASASIAQVYTARLRNGADVVIKIVRPNIRTAIEKDVHLLYSLASWSKRAWPRAKQFRPTEIVHEFEKTILGELDMLREGANASQMHHNFAGSDLMHVPKIYFDLSRSNILVMERIIGVRISDIASLKRHQINLEYLARQGVEIFMTQVFRDRFFHADMHPGNVFVDVRDPKKPRYCAVDFGIVGTVSTEDQQYLAGNFLAFFQRDYRRIAELHIESGWIPKTTSIEDFTSAIRTVCEPIFGKPMAEVSFAQLLMNLFQVAEQFDMRIQPQLLLLQKTLFNIEGLGRELYPELNLWDTVYPFLKRWMRERYSIKNLWKQFLQVLPGWLDKAWGATLTRPPLKSPCMELNFGSVTIGSCHYCRVQTSSPFALLLVELAKVPR